MQIIFAIFWRARSRLYQNENLQENMRFGSIFQDLQDVHTVAPLQTQYVFEQNKIGLKVSNFRGMSATILHFLQKSTKLQMFRRMRANWIQR